MLILYPNYSLEIVGNYLAFPFQVVLLVSFKSNLFWLKFLHYEVFNVLAFFKARPLLASFYIVSRISDFVKNFFQLFEALFLSISMRAIASFYVVFLLSASLWQLDYLTKDMHSCQRIFASFFAFFRFLFYVDFTAFRRRVVRQGLTLCKHLLRRLCRKLLKNRGAAKI